MITSPLYAARKHGLTARQLVAFIRNRHCSRVHLGMSVDRALFKACANEAIANDIQLVARYGDLDQYTRNHQPYSKS